MKKRSMTEKSIAERNEEYEKMDPMQRRVAIAKEVIFLMDTERLKSDLNYGWVELPRKSLEPYEEYNLQTLIVKDGAICSACANGAALFARASIANSVMIRSHLHGNAASEPVYIGSHATDVSNEVFGIKLTALLEMLYEGWDIPDYSYLCEEEDEYGECRFSNEQVKMFEEMRVELASQVNAPEGGLYDCNKTRNMRMRILYQNIIDNNGQFILAGHTF